VLSIQLISSGGSASEYCRFPFDISESSYIYIYIHAGGSLHFGRLQPGPPPPLGGAACVVDVYGYRVDCKPTYNAVHAVRLSVGIRACAEFNGQTIIIVRIARHTVRPSVRPCLRPILELGRSTGTQALSGYDRSHHCQPGAFFGIHRIHLTVRPANRPTRRGRQQRLCNTAHTVALIPE